MSEAVALVESDLLELPEGWYWSTLGELSEKPQYGWTTKANHESGDIKLLRTTDITSGELNWNTVPFCTEVPEDLAKYQINEGDIFISRAGSVGFSYLVQTVEPAVFASYLIRFRFEGDTNKKYVYYYLKSPRYWLAIGASASGIAVPNVNAKKLSAVPIPIAPRDQQDRIVAEIEKQFSRLDEAVASLKRVKANLKRYKAAVLKTAVEGKLTEQWRRRNLPAPTSRPGKFYAYAILCNNKSLYISHTQDIEKRWAEHLAGKGAEWTRKHLPQKIAHYEEYDSRDEVAEREKWLKTEHGRKWLKKELAAGRTRQAGHVEPAGKLLQRILAERRARWEETELAKMKAKGKEPKDDKWKGRYKAPVAPVVHKQGSLLPNSWGWASVDQLCFVVRGASPRPAGDPKYFGGDIPWITVGDLTRDSKMYLNSVDSFVTEAGKQASRYIGPGTFLLTNSGATLGVPKIIRIGGCINDGSVALIDLPQELEKYLYYVLTGMTQKLRLINQGAAQPNLNTTIVKNIVVAVPPLAEQSKIFELVAQRLSVVEEIESQLVANIARYNRLRQSILATSFSGINK